MLATWLTPSGWTTAPNGICIGHRRFVSLHSEGVLPDGGARMLRVNSPPFYKTEHGAALGDLLMSVIETCALNQTNAFDYLVTLIRQARAVRVDPGAWLPWNYRQRPAT